MTMKVIRTACPRDCYDTCSLLVTVEDGRIVKVKGDPDHPVTRGFTCPRGAADIQRTYSGERVLYPHVRTLDRGFTRVTWDEALDTITSNLKTALWEHGPDSLLQLDYSGNMGLLTEPWAQRLWNALGAAIHDSTICSASGHAGLALHHGLTYGVEPDELQEKRLIVFWGFNAKVSAPHTWALAVKAKHETGTKIIVVDPRKSDTADSADVWIAPKPGSDIALVYGIARSLIERDLIDNGFLKEWTHGYDQFKEEALRWNLERVEEVTLLSPDQVENLADAYAGNNPSATMIGIGLQKSIYGADNARAVALIPPLLGLHRGFYYSSGQGRYFNKGLISGSSLTTKERRIFSQVGLGRLLQRGDIKFLYVNNMNPAITLPDQEAFHNGLERKDLFTVVHETHWTETARHANVVLPAQTYLEKEDLVPGYSHSYITKSNRVVEPLGESRNETWITIELARRLGLKEEWLYWDPWLVLEEVFKDQFLNGTFEDLMEGATLKLRTRITSEYQTPTGKLEFVSGKAVESGFDPLPLQHSLPSEEGGFTFLTTGIPKYTHTQFQDVYGPIPPVVWINPRDAERMGVADGDPVSVYNERGAIRVEAVVTDRVSRGVLWSPRLLRGLKGELQNLLMPGDVQALGGGPVFNSTIVNVSPEKRS
jgi:anaerobic selenocysteine-containing dehydrogenase